MTVAGACAHARAHAHTLIKKLLPFGMSSYPNEPAQPKSPNIAKSYTEERSTPAQGLGTMLVRQYEMLTAPDPTWQRTVRKLSLLKF